MSNTPFTGDERSTKDVAADNAGQLKDHAGAAGQDVVNQAKGEAQSVAGDAKLEIRGLANTSMNELRGQAGNQQRKLAEGVRAAARELAEMADHADGSTPAGPLARTVADTGNDIASWLENNEPGDAVTEVRRFAARRPLAFLGIAAGAGLVIGRFARSMAAEQRDQGDQGSYGQGYAQTGYPQRGYATDSYVQPTYTGHEAGYVGGTQQSYTGTQPTYTGTQPTYTGNQPYADSPGTNAGQGFETRPVDGYDPNLGYRQDPQGGQL